MTTRKKIPVIKESYLEAICRVVADTHYGLKGSEIGKAIRDAKMIDTHPELTKWIRLYNSCIEIQNRTQCANNILTLIQTTYHPTRFINKKAEFEERRSEINKILSFLGLELTEKGQYRSVLKAETISDAEKRATELMARLKDRNVHPDVLKFCRSELLENNYFHAVFETTKSIADKIRSKTGQTSDGADLIDNTFRTANPILKINNLITDTEISEHKGFANLLKGVFGMFRNTTAHAPRISWVIEQEDALDMMSIASLIHRKLDKAIKII